jgi:hypothetical protein
MSNEFRFSNPTVLVDFNSRDANGYTPGLVRNIVAGAVPMVGDWVTARDVEGNSCDARVMFVGEKLIRVSPLFSTWVHAGRTLDDLYVPDAGGSIETILRDTVATPLTLRGGWRGTVRAEAL